MKSPLKQIIRIGLFHLSVASTYTSFNTLVTYIHSEMGHRNLGPLILIFGSISVIFFNILIPNLNIKMKNLLLIYGCCMTTNYLLNFTSYLVSKNVVATFLILVGTIISGFGVAIIGIVAGKYVSILCKEHNKQKQEGKYYGIYGALTQSSFLTGSFISVSTLSLFTLTQYYFCLAIIAILCTFCCLIFIQNVQKNDSKDIQKQQFHDKQKKSLINCNISCFFLTLKTYRKMVFLFPIQFAYGLMSGFIVHCLQDLIFLHQPNKKKFYLTLATVFMGFGAIIGSYLAGILSDKLKLHYVGKIGIVAFSIGAFVSVMSLHYKITYLAFLTAFIWGFSILFLFNWLNIVCSRIFNGSIQSFAANRQICTISFIIFQIYISFIEGAKMNNFMYYQLTGFVIIAFIGWATMNQKLLSKKPNNKIAKSQIELNQVQMQISDRKSNINSQELHHQAAQHNQKFAFSQQEHQENKNQHNYQMMPSPKSYKKDSSGDLQQINMQQQNIGSCTDVNQK